MRNDGQFVQGVDELTDDSNTDACLQILMARLLTTCTLDTPAPTYRHVHSTAD